MVSTSTLRVLEPAANILAFYDGRIPVRRLHSSKWNWLDDAAYSLGVASYVIFDDSDALIYDTSISIQHAEAIRKELLRRGIKSMRVVLSHHHKDHVAGSEAFSDCEIIAGRKTAEALVEKQDSYAKSDPPIAPLIMPTNVFDGIQTLKVGSINVELRPLDIHSYDGVTLYLPSTQFLLAGDALEDSATYVAEPRRLEIHLAELERLSTWEISAILPCHGDPDRIAQGGYDTSFIAATRDYVTKLLQCRQNPDLAELKLLDFANDSFKNGSLIYCEAYEAVHQDNLRAVLEGL